MLQKMKSSRFFAMVLRFESSSVKNVKNIFDTIISFKLFIVEFLFVTKISRNLE
jgi:hypothetical protein